MCEEKEKRGESGCQLMCVCQPLLGEDLVCSVRTQAQNYFAKCENCWPGGVSCECVVLCCHVLIRVVLLSATDEYKMKGVEKVKYISGEEGSMDGQDSTVRGANLLFLCLLSCL